MTKLEDRRLLTGRGRYVDDLDLPGMLHLAVLRSPYAHAAVTSLDVRAASSLPGVAAVLTPDDLGALGRPLPPARVMPGMHHAAMFPALARVPRYVGEPVAAVAAASRYAAEDALEAMAVAYDPLPPVASLAQALAAGAPPVHPEAPGNVAGTWQWQVGDPDAAFAAAGVTVSVSLHTSRGTGSPMETRGCIAQYDPLQQELTLHCGTQAPHRYRRILAEFLELPLHKVRVVVPDTGGGFGVKALFYPEYLLACVLAIRTGRPVKYIEDRREHMLATTQDREQVHELELAASRDGRILGLRGRVLADLGAYAPFSLLLPIYSAIHLLGCYRVPNVAIALTGLYTNKVPIGPNRGAGRPQGIFSIERALDRLARALDLDPAEVRRRNLVEPAAMPYDTGLQIPGGGGVVYDSGDYPRLLATAMQEIGYDRLRAEQPELYRQGRLVGIGLACYVEGNGEGPEGVTVRYEPSGRVVVITGAPTQGQGQPTTLAQIVATELGIAPEQILAVAGDTAAIPYSVGTFGSRVGAIAGSAALVAARQLVEKIRQAGARVLECDPRDVDVHGGQVAVRGVPGRSLPIAALLGHAMTGRTGLAEPGLEATAYFTPTGATWPSGAHAVVAEVDPDTAAVQILRYLVVHDCGTVLHPVLVEGQIAGSTAQGVGCSLYENLIYDDQGQLLTATLMDYTLPTAMEMPALEIHHLETPSPLNPLGAKGAGEGGCLGAPAALAAAIEDALRPLGIQIDALPLNRSWLQAQIASRRNAVTQGKGDAR